MNIKQQILLHTQNLYKLSVGDQQLNFSAAKGLVMAAKLETPLFITMLPAITNITKIRDILLEINYLCDKHKDSAKNLILSQLILFKNFRSKVDDELLELVTDELIIIVLQNSKLWQNEKSWLLKMAIAGTEYGCRRWLDKLWSRLEQDDIEIIHALYNLSKIVKFYPTIKLKIEFFLDNNFSDASSSSSLMPLLVELPHPGWRQHPILRLSLKCQMELPLVTTNSLNPEIQLEILRNEANWLKNIDENYCNILSKIDDLLRHEFSGESNEGISIVRVFEQLKQEASPLVVVNCLISSLIQLNLEQDVDICLACLNSINVVKSNLQEFILIEKEQRRYC